jgi:hypothetical protein
MDSRVENPVLGRLGSVEFRHDAPSPRHQNTVRDGQHLREIRRNDDHRLALPGKPADLSVNVRDGTDIDTACWFIENDNGGILCQRFRQHDLLLIATASVKRFSPRLLLLSELLLKQWFEPVIPFTVMIGLWLYFALVIPSYASVQNALSLLRLFAEFGFVALSRACVCGV